MAVRLTVVKGLFARFGLTPNPLLKKQNFHLGSRLKSQLPHNFGARNFCVSLRNSSKSKEVTANHDLIYRVATVDDREPVLKLLRNHFFPEEPLTLGQPHSKADEEFLLSMLQHGTSVVAIDRRQNDNVIGVILAEPYVPTSTKRKQKLAERIKDTDKLFADILNLLVFFENSANIFERYNVKKALQYFAVSVHKDYRGEHVPVKMDEAAEMNAKILGYPLKFAMITSHYTLRICKNLQLECVQRLKYADYKDSKTGQQVFNPPPPHTEFGMFAKRLN